MRRKLDGAAQALVVSAWYIGYTHSSQRCVHRASIATAAETVFCWNFNQSPGCGSASRNDQPPDDRRARDCRRHFLGRPPLRLAPSLRPHRRANICSECALASAFSSSSLLFFGACEEQRKFYYNFCVWVTGSVSLFSLSSFVSLACASFFVLFHSLVSAKMK